MSLVEDTVLQKFVTLSRVCLLHGVLSQGSLHVTWVPTARVGAGMPIKTELHTQGSHDKCNTATCQKIHGFPCYTK